MDNNCLGGTFKLETSRLVNSTNKIQEFHRILNYFLTQNDYFSCVKLYQISQSDHIDIDPQIYNILLNLPNPIPAKLYEISNFDFFCHYEFIKTWMPIQNT